MRTARTATRRSRPALILAIAALLATALPAAAATPPPVVSFASSVVAAHGRGAAMAAAPDGTLRVAYEAADGLWYARQTASGWSRSLVAAADVVDGVSLALDGTGKAHIAYLVQDAAGIRYATDRWGGWKRYTVTSDETDAEPALAVDAEGEVTIAFVRDVVGTSGLPRTPLMQVSNRRGYWQVSRLTNPPAGGSDRSPSIVADKTGALHIALLRAYPTSQGIRYLTNASGSWATRSISSLPDRAPRIALGPTGHVFVGFLGEAGFGFATNRTGSWVTKRDVISIGWTDPVSIAVDGSDKLHAAWHGRWSTERSGTWTTVDLAVGGNISSLVLGKDGLPRLATSDTIWYGFDYAVVVSQAVRTWSAKRLATTWASGGIAVADTTGALHVAWQSSSGTTSGLRYATDASGTWTYAWITTDPEASNQFSLAVDATGKAHVAYWSGIGGGSNSRGIRYATNASGSWASEVVTTGNDHFPGIAIGPDGSPWVSIDRDAGVRLFHRTGGAWAPVPIPGWATGAWGGRLAIDSAGAVHLAMYRTSPTPGIAYATNASGAWVSRVFADGAAAAPALALDAAGRPHVVFTDGGRARHATNATGAWLAETVYPSGDWPQVGIDPGGVIWVLTTAEGGVVVSHRVGTKWSPEILPIDPWQVSLAATPGGPAVVVGENTGGLVVLRP